MWFSRLRKPDAWRAAIELKQDRDYSLWILAVFAIIIGTLTFNLALAFANTNVFRISESHVMLAEMALLGAALLLALSRGATFYVILVFFAAYMTVVLALRPELDLKAIRDILIPIVFYFIGRQFRQIEEADRLVWFAAILVIGIGLFEFFLLDTYARFVDIFQYYVARGTLGADDNFVEGSNLFISSTRIGGRYFFGFLNNIRASSVFLEPVTMGNFGAFLCLWALFRSDMTSRMMLFGAAFVVIILADARFGLFVCLAFFPVALVYKIVPRLVWLALPFIFLAALAMYGGWTNEVEWEDNLPGRVLHSAQITQKLTLESFFGIARELPFVDDNGFAYTLSQIGMIGAVAFWALFIYAKVESGRAVLFKALATTFICLMMTVSNSFYSIKLAALFWVVAGAADGTLLREGVPFWQQLQARNRKPGQRRKSGAWHRQPAAAIRSGHPGRAGHSLR